MKTLVVATQNKGKVAEIKKILENLPIDVKTMSEIGLDFEVEENGNSFEENAIIKAEALKAFTDAIILADDSGLEIDVLNKEPGIYSARYLGKDTSYDVKNKIILDRLKDIPQEKRTARFVCSMAMAGRHITTQTTNGIIEGYIGYEAKGENGFGYDPIFFVSEYEMSTAEMSSDLKNEISHRGKALRAIKEKLEGVLKQNL